MNSNHIIKQRIAAKKAKMKQELKPEIIRLVEIVQDGKKVKVEAPFIKIKGKKVYVMNRHHFNPPIENRKPSVCRNNIESRSIYKRVR